MSFFVVWRGTFTEPGGRVYDCVIRLDEGKLANSLSRRGARSIFKRARQDGVARGTRCKGAVKIEVCTDPDWNHEP